MESYLQALSFLFYFLFVTVKPLEK